MTLDRRIIEAQLALNLIPSDTMPGLAWDALEAGFDGPAIRRLAALERPTWFEVNGILTNVMQEIGLQPITGREAAIRIAVHRGKKILESDADPSKFIGDFQQLWIATKYESEIQELGVLEDDVHVARMMGNNEQTIREMVAQRIRDFIAKHSE